jgi:ribA/ribD-fused uncharacterized protein
MGDPVVISYFDDFEGENEWRFLSNFYVGAPLAYRSRTYRTGEHMFQAFKAVNAADHDMINAGVTPGEAKANGRHYLRLRPDWERVKFDVMRIVLRTKFAPGREEYALLAATGDALLVEGTQWGDRVWGVDLKKGRQKLQERLYVNDGHASQTGPHEPSPAAWEPGEGWEDAPGRNWLGVLLMARRAEIVAEMRGCPLFRYGQTIETAETIPTGK